MTTHEALSRFARATDTTDQTAQRLAEQLRERGVLQVGAERWGAVLRARPARLPVFRRQRIRWRPLVAFSVVVLLLTLALAYLQRPAPPLAFDRPLSAESRVLEQPWPGLELDYQGLGHLEGSQRAATIRWEQGRVQVQLESPGQLVLRTREALVRVTGTLFEVQRDAFGTQVQVSQGSVQVECATSQRHELAAGERASCEPVSGPALLGMARRLQREGAPAARVLAVVARAEALPALDEPLRGELCVVRLEVLLAAERFDEALATARAYLEAGHQARAQEIELLLLALQERASQLEGGTP